MHFFTSSKRRSRSFHFVYAKMNSSHRAQFSSFLLMPVRKNAVVQKPWTYFPFHDCCLFAFDVGWMVRCNNCAVYEVVQQQLALLFNQLSGKLLTFFASTLFICSFYYATEAWCQNFVLKWIFNASDVFLMDVKGVKSFTLCLSFPFTFFPIKIASSSYE